MKINHKPVLINEAIESLNFDLSNLYIDATLGSGGYSKKILEQLMKKNEGVLLSFDLDQLSIENFILDNSEFTWRANTDSTIGSKENVKVILVNENFAKIKEVIIRLREQEHIESIKISNLVADLGLNSEQLDHYHGFSFKNEDQELDMRLDRNLAVKASDYLLVANTKQLTETFEKYGDLNNAWKIATAIKEKIKKPNCKVGDLVKVINNTFGINYAVRNDLHAKVFQALRIVINSEFENLEELLNNSFDLLERNAHLSIVSFHSGEDRIAKHFFKEKQEVIEAKELVFASQNEINENNRARSAKLRTLIKKIDIF